MMIPVQLTHKRNVPGHAFEIMVDSYNYFDLKFTEISKNDS
jgi:hypothetical protein